MVNVAVAGGNGAIGRTLLEMLQQEGKHQAFVLSRKDAEASAFDRTIKVDYNDVDGVTAVLEKNEIHTVICAFAISGGSLKPAQLNLIHAASRSSKTKRFIPTSFAIAYPRESVDVLAPQLGHYFECLDALEQSNLEWTAITNGIFLDYYAMPHIKTHLQPNVIAIDIENRAAAIPGSGDVPITFTYTYDVARFVVASLSLPTWSRESRIVGDTVTWNEFVTLAEEIVGTKFDTTHDSVEKLKASEITELPGHRKLYEKFPKKSLQWFLAIFELWTTDNTSCVPREGSLNDIFPEIKPMTVREMLTKCWATK